MSANLSQTQLNRILAATYQDLPEHRRGQNCVYRLADAAWAAFLVFFSQARSFLERRRDAGRPNGRANAASLFGAGPTPTDPQIRKYPARQWSKGSTRQRYELRVPMRSDGERQIRNLLDPLLPSDFYRPFHTILQRLKAGGYLQAYRTFANNLLIGLDGVRYFSSHTLHCPECSVTQHDDQVTYSHAAILPVLVAPM